MGPLLPICRRKERLGVREDDFSLLSRSNAEERLLRGRKRRKKRGAKMMPHRSSAGEGRSLPLV